MNVWEENFLDFTPFLARIARFHSLEFPWTRCPSELATSVLAPDRHIPARAKGNRVRCSTHSPRLKSILLLLVLSLLSSSLRADDQRPASSDTIPVVWTKATPENLDDLKSVQKQVRAVVDKAMRCTVGIRIGPASGSGVLVSEDGYILTAGHVAGEPGRDATVILFDGRQVKAKTLGSNRTVDSGLIKITEEGKWPFMEMGDSVDLRNGQWCIAVGHPGGIRKGRTPVVRLGRILNHNDSIVRTDCTIMGGDSGGPLFDLDGKVIGIHSRIGGALTANIHVPVDTYRDTWQRLSESEVWGYGIGASLAGTAYLGVEFDQESRECRIAEVVAGSAAAKAGIKPGDVVVQFDNHTVGSAEDLIRLVAHKNPGDRVALVVQRDDDAITLRVTLSKRDG